MPKDTLTRWGINLKNVNLNSAFHPIFPETKAYEQGFAGHYADFIAPHVVAFEAKRKEAFNQFIIRMSVVVLLFLFVGFFVPFLATVIGGFGYIWAYRSTQNYKSSLKKDIFPNILSFFEDFFYRAEIGSRVQVLEKSYLIPNFSNEFNQDFIKGTYKGVGIELFECKLVYGNDKHKTTQFNGLFITLTMNKPFHGQTVVRKNLGFTGGFFKNFLMSNSATVALEDPLFNKYYTVYSTDQIEARYLLTTSFMTRLLELDHSFGGNVTECSFYDNKLLLKIDLDREFFEPGPISVKEDFIDDAKSILRDMQMIFNLIDTLHLDKDIGL